MLQAGRRSLSIRAFAQGQRGPSKCAQRNFTRTSRTTFPLAVNFVDRPVEDAASYSESIVSQRESNRKEAIVDYVSRNLRTKYDNLLDSLGRDDANPNRVWGYYCDYLDFTRDGNLPLEIHQQVLRKCAPHPKEVKRAFVLGFQSRRSAVRPHRHETRFLEVMNNIRRDGNVPDVADYEHILSHFAAVGHYIGAAQILQEINQLNIEPRTATYNLCLQAIAYRLTLPCLESDRIRIQKQCSELCKHILNRIQERNSTIPSGCLDLAHRIMKDTNDVELFMHTLKIAYGIDLNYLDRHALSSEGALEKPVPFSTSALTTLVDFLGKEGKISQMVSAFEVLSAPLSVGSFESRSKTLEDDDEDEFFIPSDSNPIPPSSAKPNITTYNTLIRHCCAHKNLSLASHYFKATINLDQILASKLREDVQTLPLTEVCPPDLQANMDTIRPMLGLANRVRNNGLLKWLVPTFRRLHRRKKEELRFYSGLLLKEQSKLIPQSFDERIADIFDNPKQNGSSGDTIFSVKSLTNLDSNLSFFTSSVPTQLKNDTFSSTTKEHDNDLPKSDLAGYRPPPSAKRLDLALHVRILERNVAEMKEFDKVLGVALERLITRTKEKLGRRVWAGKKIYLRDANARVLVERKDWIKMVNFGLRFIRKCLLSTVLPPLLSSHCPVTHPITTLSRKILESFFSRI